MYAPMTSRQYVFQKIFIGFMSGCLSAASTAAICFKLSPAGAADILDVLYAGWVYGGGVNCKV